MILDEAKVWAYAGHTLFFLLFPELLHEPLIAEELAVGRDMFTM